MKQWVKKLVDQFEIDWKGGKEGKDATALDMSDERATLLYFIDTYSKHLFETEKMPVRKTRELLDSFAKELLKGGSDDNLLFRLRQFFGSYRIDEFTYIQTTFDDFKTIIWDFADQLSEDIRNEKSRDAQVHQSLNGLREAVEANSIDELRAKSREFINLYIEHQSKKDERRTKRIDRFKKNLNQVKQKLVEATQHMMTDHLTGAYNRRSFDEQLRNHLRLFEFSKVPVCLIILDIDHFKKINDSYGHDLGDFVIRECVNSVKAVFDRPSDFVARIGGEEFAVLLPETSLEEALRKSEELLEKIRRDVFVQENLEIRFTVSMGLAQCLDGEGAEAWLKRADEALYQSKNKGRDRCTLAAPHEVKKAA
ncbi:MAG: GGDEF domain-containing protein [Bdellovibrionaceae bacterium]|nr:GGDEF domain-containing protein [Pseudobdellovibrionaceae bacterium]